MMHSVPCCHGSDILTEMWQKQLELWRIILGGGGEIIDDNFKSLEKKCFLICEFKKKKLIKIIGFYLYFENCKNFF